MLKLTAYMIILVYLTALLSQDAYAQITTDFQGFKSYDDSYVRNGDNMDSTSSMGNHWVEARNGDVPGNAVIYRIDNGFFRYYCRVPYNNTLYYGTLFPRNGCIISTENQSTLRFIIYEVYVIN